jgi:tRNA(Ile)-lysidine synthase
MSTVINHPIAVSVKRNLTKFGVSGSSAILVGVSGGVDSMVLLFILHRLGYNVTAGHVNFNLRGAASTNDALFVQKWCADLGIPYHELSQDTKAYALENKLNTQSAAREIRYAWWESLVHGHPFDYVATAHHLDDAIETVLLNLFRGTGMKGIKGIPALRDFYIRPLLDCSRASIEAFSAAFDVPFSTDESNASDKYQRNKLRHHLVPILREMYPDFHASMQHTLLRVNTEWETYEEGYQLWIESSIKPFADGFQISGHHQQMAYQLRWLEEKGIPWNLVYDFITAPGKDTGHMLQYENQRLSRTHDGYFLEETPAAVHIILSKPGRHVLGNYVLSVEKMELEAFEPTRDPMAEYVNDEVITWPLHLRSVRQGDYFQPIGMQGKSKKVQDLMVDHKLEMFEKERLLILSNDEHILWIIGLRLDERARVTPETKSIYRLTYSPVASD